jgi:hypothetical protein
VSLPARPLFLCSEGVQSSIPAIRLIRRQRRIHAFTTLMFLSRNRSLETFVYETEGHTLPLEAPGAASGRTHFNRAARNLVTRAAEGQHTRENAYRRRSPAPQLGQRRARLDESPQHCIARSTVRVARNASGTTQRNQRSTSRNPFHRIRRGHQKLVRSEARIVPPAPQNVAALFRRRTDARL